MLNNPLDWKSISYLLEHFTAMDESSRLEARRRYEAFINQPLRRSEEGHAAPHRSPAQHAGGRDADGGRGPELASTPIRDNERLDPTTTDAIDD